MAYFSLAALRTILSTETDDGSPLSEELLSQYRENIEALLMLGYDTGVTGAADSDPPNDTTGVLTDAAPGFTADDHNGRTLLITSGLANGNIYTIDDTTTTTLVCTGDNLYSDGVRQADTYKIFYDLKVNTDGHNHDGVNSAVAPVPAGSIMLPCIMSSSVTAVTTTPSVGGAWEDVTGTFLEQGFRIYIPPNYTYIYAATRMSYGVAGPNYGRLRFRIGATYSAYCQSNSTSYAWFTDCVMDISSLSGWQDFVWQVYSEDTSPVRAINMQGFAMYVG